MIKDAFERLLFAGRYLLAPLYLALAISLVALIFKAGLHLYQLLTELPTMSDEEVLLSDLAIVDLTLTASLVVIVFLSGYSNFVTPVVQGEGDGRPHWIAEIDFSELKLKLMASIVAISAIKLLEGFMDLENHTDRELYWLGGIHLSFVFLTLALAPAPRFRRPPPPPNNDAEGDGPLFLQNDFPAFGRQRRHRQRRLGQPGARMQRLVGKPPGERLVAAVARRDRVLRLAAGIAGGAFDADMEMVIVPPIGAHLVHPGLAPRGLAERLLDRRIDEDALDLRLRSE